MMPVHMLLEFGTSSVGMSLVTLVQSDASPLTLNLTEKWVILPPPVYSSSAVMVHAVWVKRDGIMVTTDGAMREGGREREKIQTH